MKKFKLLALLLFATYSSYSQSTELSESVALKFSNRLYDSLRLTSNERQGILEANRLIARVKFQARNVYKQTDSLTLYTQRAEDMRDSLYRRVLTEDKYLKYLADKIKLINNN